MDYAKELVLIDANSQERIVSRASGRECWLAPGRLRVTLTEINKPKTSFVTYESATYSETIPQEDEMQVTHSHR